MTEVKWIKLNTDLFQHEKIVYLSDLPDGDALVVIWIRLLILAGKCNMEGYVVLADHIPYTDEMLAKYMRKPLELIMKALDLMEQLHMIEYHDECICITNWEKHQNLVGMERIRQQNKLRKQRERLKKKDMSRDSHVTVTQSHATDIELDIKNKNKKIYKTLYLETVYVSDSEYTNLLEKYGSDESVKRGIEILNNYLQASGKKYKSHYHVLIGWVWERVRDEKPKGSEHGKYIDPHRKAESTEPRFKQRLYPELPEV